MMTQQRGDDDDQEGERKRNIPPPSSHSQDPAVQDAQKLEAMEQEHQEAQSERLQATGKNVLRHPVRALKDKVHEKKEKHQEHKLERQLTRDEYDNADVEQPGRVESAINRVTGRDHKLDAQERERLHQEGERVESEGGVSKSVAFAPMGPYKPVEASEKASAQKMGEEFAREKREEEQENKKSSKEKGGDVGDTLLETLGAATEDVAIKHEDVGDHLGAVVYPVQSLISGGKAINSALHGEKKEALEQTGDALESGAYGASSIASLAQQPGVTETLGMVGGGLGVLTGGMATAQNAKETYQHGKNALGASEVEREAKQAGSTMQYPAHNVETRELKETAKSGVHTVTSLGLTGTSLANAIPNPYGATAHAVAASVNLGEQLLEKGGHQIGLERDEHAQRHIDRGSPREAKHRERLMDHSRESAVNTTLALQEQGGDADQRLAQELQKKLHVEHPGEGEFSEQAEALAEGMGGPLQEPSARTKVKRVVKKVEDKVEKHLPHHDDHKKDGDDKGEGTVV